MNDSKKRNFPKYITSIYFLILTLFLWSCNSNHALKEAPSQIHELTELVDVEVIAGDELGKIPAKFDAPSGIAVGPDGNIYVSDSRNQRIRKISPDGRVSTLAGSTEGFADGQGTAAKFNDPQGVAVDSDGNIYVADGGNHRIRKVSPDGRVSTLAGSTEGLADGQGTAAKFNLPYGLALSADGNIYVADTGNNRIRKVTLEGKVSTLAGSGPTGPKEGGFADGVAAQFYAPYGIIVGPDGNIYVSDTLNHRIRKISPDGMVSTLAGSGPIGEQGGGFSDGQGTNARFFFPSGIAVSSDGNIYVSDTLNHRIRKITPSGTVSTLAGSGPTGQREGGFADGPGTVAQFNIPTELAVGTDGSIYVSDTDNHRIRKISPDGTVSTLAGSTEGFADGAAKESVNGHDTTAELNGPIAVAAGPDGSIYVTDTHNHRILKISPDGTASTFAGNGDEGFADGQGTDARFAFPSGVAVSPDGNIYVGDSGNNRIRKISPDGIVSTLAGNGDEGIADGQGTDARFYSPFGIAVGPSGNIYVADWASHRIRKISPSGNVSTLAGSGPADPKNGGFADDQGTAARFRLPVGLVVGPSGNVYVGDSRNNRIRKISPDGTVSTLAGNGDTGIVDGQGTDARFYAPMGIAVGPDGNIYATDFGNERIRKITPEGKVSTVLQISSMLATGIAITGSTAYIVDNENNRIYKARLR